MHIDVETVSDKRRFEKMYRDYIEELGQYSSECLSRNSITRSSFEGMYSYPFIVPRLIYNDRKEPVGFYLIAFGEGTYPLTDFYIVEFYILPQYRNKGEGKKAVKEIFKNHPGVYCKFVLKKNIGALNFWKRVKEDFGCEDIKDRSLNDTPDDCLSFVFKAS